MLQLEDEDSDFKKKSSKEVKNGLNQ